MVCRADDVQVEFIMLDPYQRITLKHNNEVCSSPGSIPWALIACTPSCDWSSLKIVKALKGLPEPTGSLLHILSGARHLWGLQIRRQLP